ncbi:MAG: hypothetical protein AAAC48_04615 [Phyllobacterium sp.]|uniref:hypothetical protein n=1 Tax=Phyllobacterium sp. TaxID=1871046 RepID=UPI0030F24063
MSIIRQMITDAVKDHTIVAYSKDVNDPIYQGRDVDKIIQAIGPHDEMNVLIRCRHPRAGATFRYCKIQYFE